MGRRRRLAALPGPSGPALVLAGGGARGAYQVGMLQHLVLERGLDFPVLRGVSVGALNAAFLAQASVGASPAESLANLKARVEELVTLWTKEITGDASVYSRRLGFLGLALGADSLFGVGPLKELLQKHIDEERLRTSGRNFAVGYVSLESGLYEEKGPAAPDFRELVLASASMPVIFPFVRRGEGVLVDGGVRNITPLGSAFAAKPSAIWVLLTSRLLRSVSGHLPPSAATVETPSQWQDNLLGTKVNGLDVLKRTVELLTDEIYLDDLDDALDWNGLLRSVEETLKAAEGASGASGTTLPAPLADALKALLAAKKETGKSYVPLNVLAPQEWFGEKNDATDFSPAAIEKAIEHGRKVAADASLWIVRS